MAKIKKYKKNDVDIAKNRIKCKSESSERTKIHCEQIRRLVIGEATEIDKKYIKRQAIEYLNKYEKYINSF